MRVGFLHTEVDMVEFGLGEHLIEKGIYFIFFNEGYDIVCISLPPRGRYRTLRT